MVVVRGSRDSVREVTGGYVQPPLTCDLVSHGVATKKHLFVCRHGQVYNLLVAPVTEGFLELVAGVDGGALALHDRECVCVCAAINGVLPI